VKGHISGTHLGENNTMALQVYLRAIATGWWIVVITLVAGLGLATAYNSVSNPVYSTTVKFFVSTQSEAGESPLQADEFAQRRINSYVQLMTSEAMTNKVIESSGVDLSASQLTKMISAYSDPETVLLGVEVHDTDKERSFDIASAIAQDFGTLVAQLDNRGNSEVANVKLNVVSGPTLADDPISPRTNLNLALGGIVGLGLGLAIAILRKTGKKTVGTESEAKEVLGLPSIGFIPRLRRGTAPDAQPALMLATERLVTTLELDLVPEPRHRVLHVASADSSDGRTMLATSMARALAARGRRVVVVETDLRSPRLAQAFDVESSPGLAAALCREPRARDAHRIAGGAAETSVANLWLLPAGDVGGVNPAELLSSARFGELVSELRANFDLVILDTAPLSQHVDSAIVARAADGIVFVVSRDRSTKEHLRAALAALEPNASKLIGIVMNAAPARFGIRTLARAVRLRQPRADSSTTTTAPLLQQ
jgi:capsular exopolysaccharide synthesis family protein